jgi:hypothetical protein
MIDSNILAPLTINEETANETQKTEIDVSEAEIHDVQSEIQKDQEALAIHSNDGLSSYNLIADQNIQLSRAIQNSMNNNNTSNQKYNYQSGDIVFLNKINNYLFYIYYFILLFVCYFFFYDNIMRWKLKVGILFIFVIYPYVFNLISYYLSKFLVYIYSVINITAYQYN